MLLKGRIMKMLLQLRIIPLLSLFFFAMFFYDFADAKGQSMVYQITLNNTIRSYIVYKPLVTGTKGLPLMIVLHGGLGNAEHIEKMTGMNEIADTGKFLVAYPNGTEGRFALMKNKRTWNAGRCCGQAVKQKVDDVFFIKKMIEDIHTKFLIDTRRVYVTGMSNGAMMAYRLACEIPDKIAAIIPVSGTLAVDNCDKAKDIPVLHIHGDQDKNVPFAGGRGEAGVEKVGHRSVPDTMKLILQARQCSPPERKTLNGNIQIFSYCCSNGAPVVLYIIKGGGHVWPGGKERSGRDCGSRYFSASKLAWEFAKQFSKTR